MRALSLLVLATAVMLSGCAAAIKSSDYGLVSVKKDQSVEAVAYGESEREAVDRALNAAVLYCQEAGLGQSVDAASHKVEYRKEMDEPFMATLTVVCGLKIK
ncbi:hypothetical protein LJB86_00245 [Deltaproteobacteria bacterium OttesenSCG-928-M10]|nr:hypothetical protein [Deltaproteobacteria bacterium OttesenSCG-928-M10]